MRWVRLGHLHRANQGLPKKHHAKDGCQRQQYALLALLTPCFAKHYEHGQRSDAHKEDVCLFQPSQGMAGSAERKSITISDSSGQRNDTPHDGDSENGKEQSKHPTGKRRFQGVFHFVSCLCKKNGYPTNKIVAKVNHCKAYPKCGPAVDSSSGGNGMGGV